MPDPIDPNGVDTNCDGVDGVRSNQYYVNGATGNDTTGAFGDTLRPYRTIAAVLTAIAGLPNEPATVEVLITSNSYNEDTATFAQFWKGGVRLRGSYQPTFSGRTSSNRTQLSPSSSSGKYFAALGLTGIIDGIEIFGVGSSSFGLGLLLSGSSVQFIDARVTAPAGANGADGLDGGAGAPGVAAVTPFDEMGSPGGMSVCGLGGPGGRAGLGSTPGEAGGPSNMGGGAGMTPGSCNAMTQTGTPGSAGGAGSNGVSGAPGTNGTLAITETGTFTVSGLSPVWVAAGGNPGSPGGNGTPGRGGGGGAGVVVSTAMTQSPMPGYGGQGGAAPGCGGTGGLGGGRGFPSVGILATNSQLSFSNSTVVSGPGGTGGRGGVGGPGGGGATQFPVINSGVGCALQRGQGGRGGNSGGGGAGGAGAGGNGGDSIGFWFLNGASQTGATVMTSQPGAGGASSAGAANAGAQYQTVVR